MKDPRVILHDLQTELSGELLEGNFTIKGRDFYFKLPDEERSSWIFSKMKSGSEMSFAMSSRVATLAASIRSIDGASLENMFSPFFEDEFLPPQKEEILKDNFESMELVYCAMFLDYLKALPASFVTELHKALTELESRKVNAQEEIKNLSGEDSEKAMKTNMTESSPDGEN